jgi:hypothetical protein
MRLSESELEKIRSLEWIYFIEDQTGFGLNKTLLCTADVMCLPNIKKMFDMMINNATVMTDPAPPNNVVHVLTYQIRWKGDTGMDQPTSWFSAYKSWALFAEWGYEMMPHEDFAQIRTISPEINKKYPKAKDLKDLGIPISHIILVNYENMLDEDK